jgi:hypothetical protein
MFCPKCNGTMRRKKEKAEVIRQRVKTVEKPKVKD